jgi:hypothetical protein
MFSVDNHNKCGLTNQCRECRNVVRRKRDHIPTALERLKRYIKINDKTNCWEWTGVINKNSGYGHITYNKKIWKTHRLTYFLLKKDFDPELCVLHKCDNKTCCNPDHLEQGTHKMNSQQMAERNRSLKGEKSPQAKLTEKQVIEIRNNSSTYKKIAEKYNVSDSLIWAIKNNRAWKHI